MEVVLDEPGEQVVQVFGMDGFGGPGSGLEPDDFVTAEVSVTAEFSVTVEE